MGGGAQEEGKEEGEAIWDKNTVTAYSHLVHVNQVRNQSLVSCMKPNSQSVWVCVWEVVISVCDLNRKLCWLSSSSTLSLSLSLSLR